jgi:hypothetical protein
MFTLIILEMKIEFTADLISAPGPSMEGGMPGGSIMGKSR